MASIVDSRLREQPHWLSHHPVPLCEFDGAFHSSCLTLGSHPDLGLLAETVSVLYLSCYAYIPPQMTPSRPEASPYPTLFPVPACRTVCVLWTSCLLFSSPLPTGCWLFSLIQLLSCEQTTLSLNAVASCSLPYCPLVVC